MRVPAYSILLISMALLVFLSMPNGTWQAHEVAAIRPASSPVVVQVSNVTSTFSAATSKRRPNCECLTEILNFQPSGMITASPLNGAANTTATITFQLEYAGIPTGDALDFGIVPAPASGFQWLQGSGSIDGSPYYCGPNAHCYFQPSSNSGSNATSFTITFGSTPATYDLEARVYVLNSTYFDVFQAGGQLFADHGFSVTVPASVATATSNEGLTIPGLGITISYTTLAGSVIPVIGLISGYLFKTRKRRLLTNYLVKIDSVYKQYSTDKAKCAPLLEDLKSEITDLLRKGKLEDSHFELLLQKIEDYLRDLSH